MEHSIPFNKPSITGNELAYIKAAVESGKISGDGSFTKKCHRFFEETYGFKKVLLTTSCTDALEMAAILLDIREGDEVIVPSYTFVSSANAFVLRGAKIVFVDSRSDGPNLNENLLEGLITPKTKAIVVVHYAGIACNMDVVMQVAEKHSLYVVEDAAQSIDSYYKGKPLGGIGHLAAFSFHETKNIIAGEGGMLVVNDKKLIERAEIIREKGTNRTQFFRGETDKYNWLDIGSSFLPSEIIAAFLYAQLENLKAIQAKRTQLWNSYFEQLAPLQQKGLLGLPYLPAYSTNNAHLFYLVTNTNTERNGLIEKLRENNVLAVFHYLSLHKSPFMLQHQPNSHNEMPNADIYSNQLLRLPLYFSLTTDELLRVTAVVKSFYGVN
ncbi:MAG: dTDP-4-amino-4,6-dideoxygalactose transaminase [Chitinophagales bacterium]|nr:dTDP-4-amino-4,6-dideoxygalactose transaminase [Chitinophagales bacterium]